MKFFWMFHILEQKIRKELITRPRRWFIGLTIFMAILIFLILKHLVVFIFTKDALPSAEDPNFSMKTNSIFFHETRSIGLGVRQACAVEAAARANPTREIYVLFSKPVTVYQLMTSCLAYLRQFPNVKFLRVHEAEYSKGTVMQSILAKDVIQSRFRVTHTADILKILTLNKWGGIYLDTDMIVTRPLENLPSNFVAKETNYVIAAGILSFAKDEIGTNFTGEIIKEFAKQYSPSRWNVFTETLDIVLRRLCPDVIRATAFSVNCKGIKIYNYRLFYPVDYTTLDIIFNLPPRNMVLSFPYTYHMFDFLDHYRKISRRTIYGLIAESFCPTIHNAYNFEFSA